MTMRDLNEQLEDQGGSGEDDFEIEVIDDRPEQDQRDPANLSDIDEDFELSDDEIAALGSRAQKRIKHLTWRMNEERRQREQALRERDELVQHTKRLKHMTDQQVLQYQKVLLERQKAISGNAVKESKAELALALEEGDSMKIAEAQANLTKAITDSSQGDQFEHRWNSQQQQAQLEAQQRESQPQGQQGNFERPQVSQETQQWMQGNPWFNQNIPMTSFAIGVHQDLITNQGVRPDTPEYFSALNKAVRQRFPEAFDGGNGSNGQNRGQPNTRDGGQTVEVDTSAQAGTYQRPRTRTPVAPTRGRQDGSSRSSGKVQLTRTEVQTAKQLGVPLVEYARQKRALEMESN